MIAQQTGSSRVSLFGQVVIATYDNHIEQVKEQLTRTPKTLPTLEIVRKPDSIFDYTFDDFLVRIMVLAI